MKPLTPKSPPPSLKEILESDSKQGFLSRIQKMESKTPAIPKPTNRSRSSIILQTTKKTEGK